MIDYLHKELIATFDHDDVHDAREYEEERVVNGREVVFKGQTCAKAIVGLLYRIPGSSVNNKSAGNGIKSYGTADNYGVLHVGAATQEPSDIYRSDEELKEKLYEEATINALMDPILTVNTGQLEIDMTWEKVEKFVFNSIQTPMVMTSEEVHIMGADKVTPCCTCASTCDCTNIFEDDDE